MTASERNEDGTWYKVWAEDNIEGWLAQSVVETVGEVEPQSLTETAITTVSAVPSAETTEPSTSISTTSIATAQATGTPVPPLHVEVRNISEQEDSDGDLWILGEVFNPGELPAKSIELTATLYNSDGNVVAVDSTYADMPLSLSLWFTGVLYPGEKAPFKLLMEDPGAWNDWRITIGYEEAQERHYDEHYKELEIANDSGRVVDDFLGNYRVTGEIENIGAETTGPVRVVVTTYNAAGQVVGSDQIMSELDELQPGRTTPFSVLVYAREPVASYNIIIRAIRAD